jgi:hypothetical protein
MFTEVQNNSGLVIDPPKFKCDRPIGKNVLEPLPNTSFACAIIGTAGSGKTSLLINMLTQEHMYKQCFDHVHLICPKNSMNSLKDDIWINHPADKIHNTMDFGVLDAIDRKSKDRARVKPEAESTLVVIDDMTIWLKHKNVEEKLREMIFNRRHNYCSIAILVQSYKAMPLDLRKSLSHFYMFKPRNKKESESIWEELMFVPKTVGDNLLQFDFMFGDCISGDLYRNFNRIVLPDSTDNSVVKKSEGTTRKRKLEDRQKSQDAPVAPG